MPSPYFNNVDFELASDYSLGPLVQCLADSLAILRNELIGGAHYLNFEIMPCGDTGEGAEGVARRFFELISSLDEDNRSLVESCRSKVIDIGFMSGEHGWLYESMSPRTISLMSSWGFELRFSVYGLDPVL